MNASEIHKKLTVLSEHFSALLVHHLEKEMATHSSLLAWRTAWTEEPGGLLFMESQRVDSDSVTEHSVSQCCATMTASSSIAAYP